MSTLPLDRNRPVVERDFPRQPGAYVPLDHFIQRYKEPERFLTDEVVRQAITDGEFRDNGDGLACFVLPWGDGVRYYVLAGYHKKGYRVAVTAWPHLHDREAALDSGRWASSDLDTIEQLNERHDTHFAEEWSDYVAWSKANPTPA
jgi:hypothetical protein